MTHTGDPEDDAARQEQRRLERGIREWKRVEAAALDDLARARARAKVRDWQGRLTTHVDDNDLKRQRHREQIRSALYPCYAARSSSSFSRRSRSAIVWA